MDLLATLGAKGAHCHSSYVLLKFGTLHNTEGYRAAAVSKRLSFPP